MHHLIFVLSLFLLNAFLFYPIEAKTNSFSFDLIHHDSKLSPFYNKSKSELERSKETLSRSLNRLSHFNSSMLIDTKFIEWDLTLGDYFMYIYISEQNGRLVIPSMLSGLTWIRCGYCSSDCEGTHQPLYDPNFSYSYKGILFGSKECKKLGGTEPGESYECRYKNYDSGINIFSSGVLGTDTFSLKYPYTSDESFTDIVFGCDEVHHGDFKDGVQGVLGLGQWPFSWVSQLGKRIGDNANKFSYCLVEKPFEEHSKIKFGSDLTLDKQSQKYEVKFQPSPQHVRYLLNLEAISVSNEKIEIPNKKHDMAVDIQTSLTSLPSNIYKQFIAKVKNHFGNVHAIEHPDHGTCFLKNLLNVNLESPIVVLHFSGSSGSHADFPVNPSTLFQETDNKHMICSTIIQNDEISILGSRAQIDVQMIFDLSTHLLTFASVDCLEDET